MKTLPPSCLYCGQIEQSSPLLNFRFQGNTYWICPQHLPLLIHHPEELAEKLPGLLPGRPEAGS